jgi:hypothetical protein
MISSQLKGDIKKIRALDKKKNMELGLFIGKISRFFYFRRKKAPSGQQTSATFFPTGQVAVGPAHYPGVVGPGAGGALPLGKE